MLGSRGLFCALLIPVSEDSQECISELTNLYYNKLRYFLNNLLLNCIGFIDNLVSMVNYTQSN